MGDYTSSAIITGAYVNTNMSSTNVDYLIAGAESEMIGGLGWTPSTDTSTDEFQMARRYTSLLVALTIIGKDPTARIVDAYRATKDPRSTLQLKELASRAFMALVKGHQTDPDPPFWLGNINES